MLSVNYELKSQRVRVNMVLLVDLRTEIGANGTTFDKLILRKIVKIVAIRCHILKLKCTDFGWGSAPDPSTPLGSLPRSSQTL